MALDASVHDIAWPAATGNQSKTGLPFQPKALLAFLTAHTATGWSAGNPRYMNAGAAVSSSQRGAYTAGMQDGAASLGNFRRGHAADRFITSVRQASNNEQAGSDLVSMNSDGYTHNVLALAASNAAWIALVAALGGSDITNVACVQFDAETSGAGGTQDITTVGFQPTLVILIANGRIATGYGGGGAFQISAFNAAGEQFAAWGHTTAGGLPGDASRGLRTDRCYFIATPSAGQQVGYSFSSMLSNGFRLTKNEVADAQDITALCFAGTFQSKITAFDKTTSAAPVDQDVSVGFAPKFAMYVSAMKTSGTAGTDHNRMCIGLTDGTNERSYLWGEEEQVSTTNVQSHYSNTKFAAKANNATETLDATADGSFSGNNVRFGWDVNDGVADQGVVLALGDAVAGTETSVALIQDSF